MEITTNRRNADRFIASTGKTENDYTAWATEVGRKMHINKLDAIVCAKFGVYTIAYLPYRPTELPELMSEKDAVAYLRENSINPYELAKTWLDALSDAKTFVNKFSILHDRLRPFPKTDFEQHGDKNHLGAVSKSWFRKDGINLDVQLMEINDMNLYGEWISIEDAIDFVKEFRPGTYRNPAQILVEWVEYRFKEVTGFAIKDYYVQHIIRMCEITQPSDNDDVPF
ncbi:MAG TPA: hypothetical protein VGN64_25180 [Dyadobacter sp.]|jgi:hypothetical protein|nr:hypothetical protein [Dyadobacter sp.]